MNKFDKDSKTIVNPDILCNIKAASTPIVPLVTGKVSILTPRYRWNAELLECSEVVIRRVTWAIIKKNMGAPLKEQHSAPSYLHSLKENGAPPFRKPGKEAKPRLLIGTLITEDDVVEMIAAMDVDNDNLGFRRQIAEVLVRKNIVANYHITEKYFLINFLLETIGYAAQRDFNKFKLACLLTIYLSTHLYFKWYYWISPYAVWNYFKRLMIKHTIEDSPDGQEVFEPEECYDIMSHFHTNYLSNLPLVHILTFEVHRLKLLWPFKNK